MTNDRATKIRELMADEEIFETVMNDNLSAQELHELLKEHDVEISVDELIEFSKQGVEQIIEAGYVTEDGELSEEALEAVAGGRSSGKSMMALGASAMGVALLSDYCAGAFAVAIVSNPVGWFFGGAALMVAGAYVIGRSKSKKKKK